MQMNQQRRRPRKPNSNQTFDSQGPEGKIRGTPSQIFERYMALARDATSSGDRVAAESFYQFADHYYRIMSADNENEGTSWEMQGSQHSTGSTLSNQENGHGNSSSHRRNQRQDRHRGNGRSFSSHDPSENRMHSNEQPHHGDIPYTTDGDKVSGDLPSSRDSRSEGRKTRHPYLGGGRMKSQDRIRNSENMSPRPSATTSSNEGEPSSDPITVIQ
jgi:hypothetical protein